MKKIITLLSLLLITVAILSVVPKKASAPAEPNAVETTRASIEALKNCYESGCGLGESDPKGPYFEIGKRISIELRSLEEKVAVT